VEDSKSCDEETALQNLRQEAQALWDCRVDFDIVGPSMSFLTVHGTLLHGRITFVHTTYLKPLLA